jgi:hypothetical protein
VPGVVQASLLLDYSAFRVSENPDKIEKDLIARLTASMDDSNF